MACASKQCGRERDCRGVRRPARPPSRTEAPLPYICKSVSPLLPQVNENACARSGPLRSISQVPATRWSSTIQPSTSKGGTSTPALLTASDNEEVEEPENVTTFVPQAAASMTGMTRAPAQRSRSSLSGTKPRKSEVPLPFQCERLWWQVHSRCRRTPYTGMVLPRRPAAPKALRSTSV